METEPGRSGQPAPHVIQLRGVWEYRPLARAVRLPDGSLGETTETLPPPGRLRRLADWGRTLGADFCGRVLFTRRFGQPTGLAPGDRVDLVLEHVAACRAATLNGAPVGPLLPDQECARWDITARLQRRNELAVVVEWSTAASSSPRPSDLAQAAFRGGPLGDVRLEILAAC